MPKAILEFDLPTENSEFKIAVNAGKYYSFIWRLNNNLRDVVKYSEKSRTIKKFAEEIRNTIYEELDLEE